MKRLQNLPEQKILKNKYFNYQEQVKGNNRPILNQMLLQIYLHNKKMLFRKQNFMVTLNNRKKTLLLINLNT